MANLVISGAGAAVGFMVGGPTGAQVGWMVGSYAASRYTSRKSAASSTQSVADLRVQTASYGTNIPLVSGAQRISGNIIWASNKIPYAINSSTGGGKGGGGGSISTSTGYRVNLAIALCKGPINGIRRVWSNGALIVDATAAASPLPGTLYTGLNTQLPDPTMQADLGAGNVPAYRGLAYIVLNNFDLGTTGAIPQFSFEVLKSGDL